MEFEYDPAKSDVNIEKHGIDFEYAKEVWNDLRAVQYPARYQNEERFARIGRIGSKIWIVIYTYREQNIRIISARRAGEDEKEAYEESTENS